METRNMADTYTQLLIQLVFAVQNRVSLITQDIRKDVEKYISGIVANNRHKLLAIYCMPDHCHILIGLNPNQSVADLARDIKCNTSRWINAQHLSQFNFQWQEGYAAFSYAKSQKDVVINYILNQEKHHIKKTFQEEYSEFLKIFEIKYKEKHLFQCPE